MRAEGSAGPAQVSFGSCKNEPRPGAPILQKREADDVPPLRLESMWLDFRLTVAALAALPLLVTGCATSYGSRTVRPTSTDYASAIAQAWNEQMLVNLVRLRYRGR